MLGVFAFLFAFGFFGLLLAGVVLLVRLHLLGDGGIEGFHQLVETVDDAGDEAVLGGLLAGVDLGFHSLVGGEQADGLHGGLELVVDLRDLLLEHRLLVGVEGRAGDARSLELAGLDDVDLHAFVGVCL